GAGSELLDDAPSLLALEIELDRPLAAIGAVEIRGVEMAVAFRRGNEGRPPGAGIVADALALDLDHVGAEIAEDLSGPRARGNTGKLQHTQTGQRTRHEQLLCKGVLSDPALRFCLQGRRFCPLVILSGDH